MSDWYVYAEDGAHIGPLSTSALAQGIRDGAIPADSLVASDPWFEEPGTSGWEYADELPEIVQAVAAVGTSELRVVAGAFTETWKGTPEFGSTVMMAPRLTKRG